MAGQTPYRDGLEALVQQLEERRAHARRRAAALSDTARDALPKGLRDELAQLEAALEGSLESTDAVAAAEEKLARYELALEAALAMADPGGARRRRKRIALGVVVVISVAGLGYYTRLRARYDEMSARCWSCHTDGRCHPRWLDVVYERQEDCIAVDQADCVTPCRTAGLCHFVYDACRAQSDDDCRKSERCRELGECRLVRSTNLQWGGSLGVCAIRSKEDCAGSVACREHGRCRVGDHECVR